MKKPKFLWDLSKIEVLRGIRAFLRETGISAGSIVGYYNLYKAIMEAYKGGASCTSEEKLHGYTIKEQIQSVKTKAQGFQVFTERDCHRI